MIPQGLVGVVGDEPVAHIPPRHFVLAVVLSIYTVGERPYHNPIHLVVKPVFLIEFS